MGCKPCAMDHNGGRGTPIRPLLLIKSKAIDSHTALLCQWIPSRPNFSLGGRGSWLVDSSRREVLYSGQTSGSLMALTCTYVDE